jgi:Na+/phosphate symporter
MIILLPLLVCIIGLLAYALSSNAKVSEMGRIAFAFGLLVTLWELASHVIKL